MHAAVGRLLHSTEIDATGRAHPQATRRTAFVIAGGCVLTARHNLDVDAREGWMLRLSATSADPEPVDVALEVRGSDRPLDVALLGLATDMPVAARERCDRIALDVARRVGRNDRIVTEGFPMSAKSGGLSFQGRVTDPAARLATSAALQLQLAELAASVPHQPGGQSGGPVLAFDHRTGLEVVVGVVRSYPGDDTHHFATGGTLFATRIADVADRFAEVAHAADQQERRSRRLLVSEVPRPETDAVDRAEVLDRVLAALTDPAAAGPAVVKLRGLGGSGKTYLARQAAHADPTIAHFAGRVLFEYVGRDATDFSPVLARLSVRMGETARPTLVVLDDVWSEAVLHDLCAALPDTVTALVTTRGIRFPGAVGIDVGGMTDRECLILLRGPESTPQDVTFGEIAQCLHRWPLLLHIAAQHVHRFAGDGPGAVAQRAESLLRDLQRAPTELGDTSGALDSIVARSVDLLRPALRQHFLDLDVYPEGAELGPAELGALWDVGSSGAEQVMRRLEEVGLAEVDADAAVLRLHDLIVGWLRDTAVRAAGDRSPMLHRRCVKACDLDNPTPDQLRHLGWHVSRTGRPEDYLVVVDPRARPAFVTAFGSLTEYRRTVGAVLEHRLGATPADPEALVRLVLTASLVGSQDAGLPVQAECARALLSAPAWLRRRLGELAPHVPWAIVLALDEAGRLDAELVRTYLAALDRLPTAARIRMWLAFALMVDSPAARAYGHALVLRAFDDLDEVPDDQFERFNLGVHAIKVLGRYDFDEAWRRAAALPKPVRALGAQLTLAASVPERAASLLSQLTVTDDDFHLIEVYYGYVESLAWSDLKAALRVARRNKVWYDHALARIVEAHATADPGSARTVCDLIEGRMARCRARCLLALHVPLDEVPALVDAATADLEQARYHGDAGPLESHRDALVDLARATARTSITQAVEFADGLPHPAARRDALAAVARSIVDRDPDRAGALLDLVARDSGELSAQLAGAMAHLAAVLTRLDGPSGERVAGTVLDTLLALEGRAQHEDLWKGADEAVPVLAAVLPEPTAVFVRTSLSGGMPNNRALAAFLRALPANWARLGVDTVARFPGWSRGRVVEVELIGLLARRDPRLALSFSATRTTEDRRDYVAAEIAEGAAVSDPLACPRLVNAIGDEYERGRTAAAVAPAVALKDPEAARTLVLTHVPDQSKTEILASIATALEQIDPEGSRIFAELALRSLNESGSRRERAIVARALSRAVAAEHRRRADQLADEALPAAGDDLVTERSVLVALAPVLPGRVADAARRLATEPASSVFDDGNALVEIATAMVDADVVAALGLAHGLWSTSRDRRPLGALAAALGRRAASAPPDLFSRIARPCLDRPNTALRFLAGYLDAGVRADPQQDWSAAARAIPTVLDALVATPHPLTGMPDWRLGGRVREVYDSALVAEFDRLVATVPATRAEPPPRGLLARLSRMFRA